MRLSWRYRSPIVGNESARNVRREKECNGGLCDFHSVLIQLSIKCSGSCVDMTYVLSRVSRSGITVVFCAAVVVIDVVHSLVVVASKKKKMSQSVKRD